MLVLILLLVAGVGALLTWAWVRPAVTDPEGAALAAAGFAGASAAQVRHAQSESSFIGDLFGIDHLGLRRGIAAPLILVAWLASMAIMFAITGLGLISITAPSLLALVVPRQIASVREARERTRLEEALAEFIAAMRDLVRAGNSIDQAIATLRTTGPALLRHDVEIFSQHLQESGMRPALAMMQERLDHPVFDKAAIAIDNSLRVGGQYTSDILDNLVIGMREDMALTRSTNAQLSQVKYSARIMAVLPLIILFYFRLASPEIANHYTTLFGQIALSIAFTLLALGYAVMLRLARSETDVRVLRPVETDTSP